MYRDGSKVEGIFSKGSLVSGILTRPDGSEVPIEGWYFSSSFIIIWNSTRTDQAPKYLVSTGIVVTLSVNSIKFVMMLIMKPMTRSCWNLMSMPIRYRSEVRTRLPKNRNGNRRPYLVVCSPNFNLRFTCDEVQPVGEQTAEHQWLFDGVWDQVVEAFHEDWILIVYGVLCCDHPEGNIPGTCTAW
jgi:hypothetical protein